jgi:hypothetical protein
MTPVSGVGAGGYIQHSIYLPFIKNLLKFFGRDRTLFISSQDFFDDPIAVARTAYRFLGLPEYVPVKMAVKNAGPPGTIPSASREALEQFFRPLNRELYQFLGRDFGWQ